MDTSRVPTLREHASVERRVTRDGTRDGGPGRLVLDRYRLHRMLGAGAFGTVWLAWDERLERNVAVKVLARRRVMPSRFEREAKAAARLVHPGIVTLYEAAVDEHSAYLVSELVHGLTLDSLLQDGALSDRDVLEIALALCDALDHAHAQGVIHRDVKPSNVLVPDRPATPGQLAKLTDFGVAHIVGGDTITRTGDIVGTAAYMSPEQAEGREAAPSSDLYSLAIVVYEALTGINPVRTGPDGQRARRLGAHLPPLRRQRRDLPHELGQGIDLALRPRASERGTIEDLRDALVASLDQAPDRPGVLAAGWPRRASPSRAHPATSPRAHPATSPRAHPATSPPGRPQGDPSPERWPARALAAGCVATLTGWLVGHPLAPGPLAPAAAAILAGLLSLALPAAGWIVVGVAICVMAGLAHHPGAAELLVLALLVPVALMPRRPTDWPLLVVAPALAAAGLAGAWPAIAGRCSSAWRRASLAAGGWIWLVLAGPISGGDLYLRRLGSSSPYAAWDRSLDATLHHVLGPVLISGVLAPAVVWAVGALVLPWVVGGRSLAVELVLVAMWSAGTVSATATLLAGTKLDEHSVAIQGAAVGALAGAAVALAPSLLEWWRGGRTSGATRGPELRSMESP